MGIARKVGTFFLTTAFFGLIIFLLSLVVLTPATNGEQGWVITRLFFGVFALSLVVSWLTINYQALTPRCKLCRSWNVWRNIFANESPDASRPDKTIHCSRVTKCYSCGEMSNWDEWAEDNHPLTRGLGIWSSYSTVRSCMRVAALHHKRGGFLLRIMYVLDMPGRGVCTDFLFWWSI